MEIIYRLIDESEFKLHLNGNLKSALFILLILGNNVILNYAFVLEREKKIVFLQRSRLRAI